ncbi:MAG: hypothetical protein COB66_07425 [Coxiella sp. (in: Bacteria)]|nr:MAG: hypothetical protein COB66_07425 [Coxiella sp. (in: g-proteobacteria)]
MSRTAGPLSPLSPPKSASADHDRLAWQQRQQRAVAAQRHWGHEQWQQRLQVLMGAGDATPAAAMRQLLVEVMTAGSSPGDANITVGQHAVANFLDPTLGLTQSIAKRDARIEAVKRPGEWVRDDEIAMVARALDVGLVTHVPEGTENATAFSATRVTCEADRANAPVFHVVNDGGAHWSPALVTPETARHERPTIRQLSVPGDGDCGLHTLAVLVNKHLDIKPKDAPAGPLPVTVREFEMAQNDTVLIQSRQEALETHIAVKLAAGETSLETLLETAQTLQASTNGSGDFNFADLIERVSHNEAGDTRAELTAELSASLAARAGVSEGDTNLLKSAIETHKTRPTTPALFQPEADQSDSDTKTPSPSSGG